LDNFLKAVELSPDTAEYHNSAGYTYQYMGMNRPAKKHFEIAVKLNQGCSEAYLNLGAMYD
jgi:Tfp pilus assembly protein PilF